MCVWGRGGEREDGGGVYIYKVFNPARPSGPSVGHKEVGTMAKLCVLWQLSHGKQTERDFLCLLESILGL